MEASFTDIDGTTRTSLHELYSKRYPAIRQIGRQSQVEDAFFKLDGSIAESSQKARAKIGNLDSIQTRIRCLDYNAKVKHTETADEEIDRELNISTSKRTILYSQHIECPYCLKCIRREHLDRHMLICMYNSKRDGNIEPHKETEIAVKPHPLRNLRIVATSFDAIHLTWELPIFQGGEEISDYEVSYSHLLRKYCGTTSAKSKMVHKTASCLRLCKKEPFVHGSFIIDGLSASEQYFEIKIRCKNKMGWSDYSKAVESVKTREAIHPLAPQRFHITKITSDSISFSWAPPFHSGGGKVYQYELFYEQESVLYNQEAGQKNEKIEMVEKTYKIKKDQTALTLSDLSSNTLISNIRLRSVNSFGLIGEYAKCQDVRTYDTNRENKILEEIRRVKARTETMIDSDFFQPGVLQREDKLSYLTKLQSMLKKDSNEKDEHDTEAVDAEERNASNIPLESRLLHFESKISSLQKEIEEIEQMLRSIKKNTILSVKKMREFQDEINLLHIERNSITNSSGENISSDILSCSIQHMKKEDIQKEIHKAIEDKMKLISNRKLRIFEENEKQAEMVALKSKKEMLLRDRIAAYHIFKKKLNSTSILQLQVSGHHNLLHSCMKSWMTITRYNSKIRKALDSIHKSQNRIFLKYATKKWKSIIKTNCLYFLKHITRNDINSRGDFLLAEVQMERERAYGEVKHCISNIIIITGVLDKYEFDTTLFPKDFLVELSRGDNYNSLGDYDNAIEVYRSIMKELSKNTTIKSNFCAQLICLTLERLGNTLMNANQWNSAIVNLDHLYNHAQLIRHNKFIQGASVLLAKCFFMIGEIDLAIECYLNIIEKTNLSGCDNFLPEAYLGLSSCYERLDDSDRYWYYRERHDAMTHSLEDHIKTLSAKANEIEYKSTKNIFREGKAVHFQRVSPTFMAVKKKLNAFSIDQETAYRGHLECQQEIQDMHILVKKLTDEIDIVGACNRSMQSSSLVHDNSQQIEKEELLSRLTNRKEATCKRILDKRKIEENLLLMQNNIKEETLALEQDLQLEQNHLMENLLSNKMVRCATFNAMNQNGIDAFGRRSHGRQMIALTVDSNIFVHDMYTGNVKYGFSSKEILGMESQNAQNSPFTITCAHYDHDKVYFGGTDKKIHCWDMVEDTIKFIAVGHTGMVTSLHIDNSIMMSGAIDKCLILWNSTSGEMLFRGVGHSRGISSVYCASTSFISGDIDGEIVVWEKNESERKLNRKYGLKARQNKKISVLKCSTYEIICGDESGYVKSWWLESGCVLHEKKVHTRTISDLQFNATMIVTCSMDTTLKVLDVTTFQILHTIRGHEHPVISVCFDNTVILSLSNDGVMRQWYWKGKETNANHDDVLHTFSEGESLKSICEYYGVTLKDLTRWNVNRDMRKITVGQKLIVVKGFEPINSFSSISSPTSSRPNEGRGLCCENPSITPNQKSIIAKHNLTSLASRLNR